VGILPNQYNIIINTLSHFGQLLVDQAELHPVDNFFRFSISPLSRKNSTILNTTLASVLSGVTPEQLGLTGLSSYSGISNGFSYTLYLTDPSTNTWGLMVTACNNCDVYSGMSVSLNDIDVTVQLSHFQVIQHNFNNLCFYVPLASKVFNQEKSTCHLKTNLLQTLTTHLASL
jgi:hypothetical protein